MERVYTYFISYMCKKEGNVAIESNKVNTNKKIKSLQQIRELELQIENTNDLQNVVINNFILLNKTLRKKEK